MAKNKTTTPGTLPDAPPVLPNAATLSPGDPYGLSGNGLATVNGADTLFNAPAAPGTPGLSVNDAITQFNSAPAAQQAQIQMLMYRAGGFYPAGYIPLPGVIRTEDVRAFSEAALSASRTGADIGGYINNAVSTAQQYGVAVHKTSPQTGKVGGNNLYVNTMTDPAKLSSLVDSVSTAILGHGLDPTKKAQVTSIIAAHQHAQDVVKNNAQEQKSRDQYAAGTAAVDTGTDTYLPPTTLNTTTVDPQAEAEAAVRAQNPMDAATHGGLEAGNLLLHALMSSSQPLGTGAA